VLPSPSPDCGQESVSGMSASDFQLEAEKGVGVGLKGGTPTHAKLESDDNSELPTSSSDRGGGGGGALGSHSPLPPLGRAAADEAGVMLRTSYLYGRPLTIVAAPAPSAPAIKSLKPLPILTPSAFLGRCPREEEEEDSDERKAVKAAEGHHMHYSHHATRFHQELQAKAAYSGISELPAKAAYSGISSPPPTSPPSFPPPPPPQLLTSASNNNKKLPTIYSGGEVSPDCLGGGGSSVMSSSEATSECGECCGGHAPFPSLPVDPTAPVIIPATMCKGTQISPTSVIQMYHQMSLSRGRTSKPADVNAAPLPHSNTTDIPPPPFRPAPNLSSYCNGRPLGIGLKTVTAGDDADVSSQSSSSCVTMAASATSGAVRFEGGSEAVNPADELDTLTPCKQMNLLHDPLAKVQSKMTMHQLANAIHRSPLAAGATLPNSKKPPPSANCQKLVNFQQQQQQPKEVVSAADFNQIEKAAAVAATFLDGVTQLHEQLEPSPGGAGETPGGGDPKKSILKSNWSGGSGSGRRNGGRGSGGGGARMHELEVEEVEEASGGGGGDSVEGGSSSRDQREALVRKIGRRIRFRKRRKREQKEKKTENRAKKALKTISLILGAFVTCWTPYHILAIIASFAPNAINVHVYMFAYFLCYANSPINPFCYAASNQQFKTVFKRIMRGDLTMK